MIVGVGVEWLDVPRFESLDRRFGTERGAPPRLAFHGKAQAHARALRVCRSALTLTHDPLYCIGQVVLEDGEDA